MVLPHGASTTFYNSTKYPTGGVLERFLKERGLNIEITVPPFLPLLSQTCCRRVGNCKVDVLHVIYLVIWSDELINR
jgi:hypothetical protein